MLPDFDEDEDEEDDDYVPPARKRRKGELVPVIEDDDEDNEEDEEENGNGDDKDYEEEEEEGDDEDDDEDDEEDDEEITLQTGKADQRKQKKLVAKSADVEVIMEERRTGQRCTNIKKASEFRKYIRDLMKEFEKHVMRGKQVKKYLVDLIEDVKEVCINMKYPGMDFKAEDIVLTFSDPSFKAWKAKLNGVQFTDRNDLKEANTKHSLNNVTTDRSGKDARQVARTILDSLPTAQRNDCKQILKCLVRHNTEAHESAMKAGKELVALLDYFLISAWLQVADTTT